VVRHLNFALRRNFTQQTLNEEKAANAKLTQIGETSINAAAVQERRAA